MTGEKRKRGRPRKAFFLDGSPATGARGLTALGSSLGDGSNAFEAELRKDFRVGPHVPLDLVWQLLSLDGPVLSEEERRSVERLEAARTLQTERARMASEVRTAITTARVACVRRKNADLLRKVEDGSLTRNSAVEAVRRAWAKRGHGGAMPSKRTLNNWLSGRGLQDR